MPRIDYTGWRPTRAVDRELIDHVDRICRSMAARGYNVTLRQVYYQFVAQDLFPEARRWRWTGSAWVKDPNGTKNAEPNYKALGDLITKARRAGLLDWHHIEDRTRHVRGRQHWSSPAEILAAAAHGYHIDWWATQRTRVEVWVEKDALVDVISRPADRWDCRYFSCRGNVSDSEMWRAGRRLAGYVEDDGQEVLILHLGDHDPSGVDMTRDITDRLGMFMGEAAKGLEVRRIALNMDQVRTFNPPPSPAKTTDSRARGYIEEYGTDSWELDALDPDFIVNLINEHIQSTVDEDAYEALRDQERRESEDLRTAEARWAEVVAYLNGED
jgi:hypothetical protein